MYNGFAAAVDRGIGEGADGRSVDDGEDYVKDGWAGVIPFRLAAGKPISDARVKKGIKVPRCVSVCKRG